MEAKISSESACIIIASVLLLMVEQCLALNNVRPMFEIVNKVRKKEGPYYGLVMAYPTESMALEASGVFTPSQHNPSVELAGRTFKIGTIGDVGVICVMTGEQMVNAAMTVQLLIDRFDVVGIVHYGIAGSTNDTLSLGDVAVLQYVALTSSWQWLEFNSILGQLHFGKFDFPKEGENLLASVEFTPTQVYSSGKQMDEKFWLPVHPQWFNIASKLQDTILLQCLNSSFCFSDPPKVVYGLRGSTADVYLDNAAYGKYLFTTFNISTVDEESGAVVATCLSNGVPCTVFRGVSDFSGGKGKLRNASPTRFLAAQNALIVAVKFLELVAVGSSQFQREEKF